MVSSIGTWMQTVGAQWLLLEAPNSTVYVALVQTATTLPVLLLALPAGALADTLDRRRLLFAVQIAMVAVGTVLALLTAADRMPPALLLTLTVGLGIGQALTWPAWQAMIPDLVERTHIPSAAALGAVSQNLARAIGPALAGVIIAQLGVAAVFALNASSFGVFAYALWRHGARASRSMQAKERFRTAVLAGGRYVRDTLVVRRILLRAVLFVVPGSAMWALLPLVASGHLGLDASGYGLLLGAIGVGAVFGAVSLPPLRRSLPINHVLALASMGYGAALAAIALVHTAAIVVAVLLVAGFGWVIVLSSISATLQMYLPGWVRARAISFYQITFAAGLGLGSLFWGVVAQTTAVYLSLLIASALTICGGATVRFWPLHSHA